MCSEIRVRLMSHRFLRKAFARLKYRLEQMKAKHIEEEKAEEEAERLEEEEKQKNKELKKAAATEKKEQKKQAGEAKKAQKANKPKKVKPKKVKKPKEPPKPQDILKIKPVSIVMLVLFVAGVSVLISVLSSGFYYNNSVSLAKDYYSNEQYEKAYDKLSGIKLNGSDKTLYEQASTIMYVQKQYDSYENYMKLNMKTEALDSLIKGVNRYNSLRPQAQELGIDNKFTAVYKQIVLALQDTFKISETEAIGLSSMSDTDFTNYYYRIEGIRKGSTMIAIIDYDAGNLKSVEKALVSLGEEVLVSRDSSEILQADKVILPGSWFIW